MGSLALALLFAAPPGPTLPPPQYTAGDRVAYAGEVVETSNRFDLPYRRQTRLDVTLFVLTASPSFADVAVLTRLTPLDDPTIAAAIKTVAGTRPTATGAAVRLDLLRVDRRGRASSLRPAAGLPLTLTSRTPMLPVPPLPLDGPPVVELGLFVLRPEEAPVIGTTWDESAGDRPPLRWAAERTAVWDGAEVIEVTALQQTATFTNPLPGKPGWKRHDRVWVSPADGLVRVLERRVERTDGIGPIGQVEVKYQMTAPPVPHRGDSYAAARKEIEHAVSFAVQAETARGRDLELLRVRIDRHRADHPAGEFRAAVDAVSRRLDAIARGELPAVVAPAGLPTIGNPVPDVAIANVLTGENVRLSAVRGRPLVAIFYKPLSETSAGTLVVADALAKRFPEVRILPLAVFADTSIATAQRTKLALTVPVYDGTPAVTPFGVDTFPRFLLIDAGGVLRWQFEGFGPEVGFLVKAEVEKAGK